MLQNIREETQNSDGEPLKTDNLPPKKCYSHYDKSSRGLYTRRRIPEQMQVSRPRLWHFRGLHTLLCGLNWQE